MLRTLKKYILIGILVGILYLLLSHHLVFHERSVTPLKKSQLTLEYTFFSIGEKKPINILKIEPLREAGIGQVLVDRGIITQDELYQLEDRIAYGSY